MRSKSVASVAAVALATVVALTGCVSAEPPAAAHASAPSQTAKPTPTVASAPSVRVPTTCDALVPRDAANAAAATPVLPSTPRRSPLPVAYADDRVGALSCEWKADVAADWPDTSIVGITVIPDVTKAAFDEVRNGSISSLVRPGKYGADSYTLCEFGGYGTACSFSELANGYAVVGSIFRVGKQEDSTVSAANDALFDRVHAVAASLAPPAARWEPASASIRGASTCDDLATIRQITAVFPGTDPNEYRSEGGEDAYSTLSTAQAVGSYYCVLAGSDGTWSLQLAVLPGGASYVHTAEQSRADLASVQSIAGVGDSASYFPTTGTLDIVAGNGWVQLESKGAPLDKIKAMAATVLTNLGYAG
ncbi:hypothetical protein [Leifsonia poae]|uniref:hypothetical protein n=1 Tax=Leifsonia poae TaxID=110933 RepID=UPI003D6663B2